MHNNVAVISRSKTMAIIFEESNLPEWANKMVVLRSGDRVKLIGDGEVEAIGFEYNRNGSVMADIRIGDKTDRVKVFSLQKD